MLYFSSEWKNIFFISDKMLSLDFKEKGDSGLICDQHSYHHKLQRNRSFTSVIYRKCKKLRERVTLLNQVLNKKFISTYPYSVPYQQMFQNTSILNLSFHFIFAVSLSLALLISKSILTCWNRTSKHLWTFT